MKLALLLSIGCCLVAVNFALRATIIRCLRKTRSWSEIDCTPHQDKLYEDFDRIWAGDYLSVFAEWLDNPIPPEWSEQRLATYCIERECHTNQAMVDYMNIHGYAPFCMERSVEDWVNARFWTRCKVRTDRSLELAPEEYATYFCYKVFRVQDPKIACPSMDVILSPNKLTVQQMMQNKEIRGVVADKSEQWWVGIMREIMHLSKDLNGVRQFHYGWIINTATQKNVVPLWSRYQGPTVPVRRDMPRIINAMSNGGGNITLGDIRNFHCSADPDSVAVICPEFGFLSYSPAETIVMVLVNGLILMGMTQSADGVPFVKSALFAEMYNLQQ
uniref:Luciferase c9g1i2 n=1 Tax=Odontosyllis undecimdonta TaxID=2203390 RepID=A0A2U9AG58_9ANNE|nr:luciferase c9g1i2 [Odontosyllis undecimdonta]